MNVIKLAFILLLVVGCGNDMTKSYLDSVNNKPKFDSPISSKEVIYTKKNRLEYLDALSVRLDIEIKALTDVWIGHSDEIADYMFKNNNSGIVIDLLIEGRFITSDIVEYQMQEETYGDDVFFDRYTAHPSMNFTADFYNKIYGFKKVLEAGLSKLVSDSGSGTGEITNAIEESLLNISKISNLDSEKIVLGIQIIKEDNSFRKMINDTDGINRINTAKQSIMKLKKILDNSDANYDLFNNLSKYLKEFNNYNTHISTIVDRLDINNNTLRLFYKNIIKKAVNPNYINLRVNSASLRNAIKALLVTPTRKNLDIARNAWRRVKANWMISDAYGTFNRHILPIYALENISTYDVRKDIDNKIKSWNGSLYEIEKMDESYKGLTSIEYLLFSNLF